MADVVNLNKTRKAWRRETERQLAAENRIAHGRSKAEKAVARLEEERRRGRLDDSRLKPSDGG